MSLPGVFDTKKRLIKQSGIKQKESYKIPDKIVKDIKSGTPGPSGSSPIRTSPPPSSQIKNPKTSSSKKTNKNKSNITVEARAGTETTLSESKSGDIQKVFTNETMNIVEAKQRARSEYQQTREVPQWVYNQIKIPDNIKKAGLNEQYVRASYEESIGYKPKQPEGFVGPVAPIGIAGFTSLYFSKTYGNKEWVKEYGEFTLESGEKKTYEQLQQEYGPALTLKYTSQGYVPSITEDDIVKYQREYYGKPDVAKFVVGTISAATGFIGDISGNKKLSAFKSLPKDQEYMAKQVKLGAYSVTKAFDIGFWGKTVTEGKQEGSKYALTQDYYETQKINKGDKLGAFTSVQIPAYTDVIIPLAGGAAFGAAFGAVGKMGSGAIKLTGYGAKSVTAGAKIFSKAAPVVMGGTYAVGEGVTIGKAFASGKTEGVTASLRYGARLGLGLAGAKYGYSKISQRYPDIQTPTDTYVFETDKGTKYVSIRKDLKGYTYGEINQLESATSFKSIGAGKKGGTIFEMAKAPSSKSLVSGKTVYQKSFLGKTYWKTQSFSGEVSTAEVSYKGISSDITSFRSLGKFTLFSSKKTSPTLYNKLFNKFNTESFSFSKNMDGTRGIPGKYGFKSIEMPKLTYSRTYGKVGDTTLFEDTALTYRVTPKAPSGIDTFGGSSLSTFTPTSSVFLPGSSFTGTTSKTSYPNVYFPKMDVGVRTTSRYKTSDYTDYNIISSYWTGIKPDIKQTPLTIPSTSTEILLKVKQGYKLKSITETKLNTNSVTKPVSASTQIVTPTIIPIVKTSNETRNAMKTASLTLSTVKTTSPSVSFKSFIPVVYPGIYLSEDKDKKIMKQLGRNKFYNIGYSYRKFKVPTLEQLLKGGI